jgi:hypothetical protein
MEVCDIATILCASSRKRKRPVGIRIEIRILSSSFCAQVPIAINPGQFFDDNSTDEGGMRIAGRSQSDFARHSGVSEPTIARLEFADGALGGRGNTVEKIRAALDANGIELIDENGGGPGVRLRARSQGKSRRTRF